MIGTGAVGVTSERRGVVADLLALHAMRGTSAVGDTGCHAAWLE